MSAQLYPNFSTQLANGTVSWTSLTPRALLLSLGNAYIPSNVYRSEVGIYGGGIADSDVITGLTYANNVAGGDPIQWLQLASVKTAYNLIIYNDTGNPATSQLIAYYDTASIIGFPSPLQGEDYFLYPVTPPGGYFTVVAPELLGPLDTYPLGYPLPLGENDGVSGYSIPNLVFDRRLRAKQQTCYMADEFESSGCGPPEFKGESCE